MCGQGIVGKMTNCLTRSNRRTFLHIPAVVGEPVRWISSSWLGSDLELFSLRRQGSETSLPGPIEPDGHLCNISVAFGLPTQLKFWMRKKTMGVALNYLKAAALEHEYRILPCLKGSFSKDVNWNDVSLPLLKLFVTTEYKASATFNPGKCTYLQYFSI